MPTKMKLLLTDNGFLSEVKVHFPKYDPNQKIIKQGQLHQFMYIIQSGSVRVIINAHLNKDVDLRPGVLELGPEGIFGEFSLFDDQPATADVCSITAVNLIAIDKKTLKKYLDNHKVAGYEIMTELYNNVVQQIRHAQHTVVNLYCWGIKNHSIDKLL